MCIYVLCPKVLSPSELVAASMSVSSLGLEIDWCYFSSGSIPTIFIHIYIYSNKEIYLGKPTPLPAFLVQI